MRLDADQLEQLAVTNASSSPRMESLSIDDILAAYDLAFARVLLASVRFVADELLPDDRVYTMPPWPGAFWRGEDNRTVLLGSTRALGALAAYNLAARHRPDGVP